MYVTVILNLYICYKTRKVLTIAFYLFDLGLEFLKRKNLGKIYH